MQSKTLKEKVYDLIFMKIFQNDFNIDNILKEKELAEMFNVSRAPVREALIELCNEKVLINIPRAGYQIIRLTYTDIMNATEIRKLLELKAAEKAFSNIKEEHIRYMEEEFSPIAHLEKNSFFQWYTRNINFHLYISTFAHNQLMNDTIERMLIILWRAFSQNYRMGYPFSKKQESSHEIIIQALKANDKELFLKELGDDITTMFDSFPYQDL